MDRVVQGKAFTVKTQHTFRRLTLVLLLGLSLILAACAQSTPTSSGGISLAQPQQQQLEQEKLSQENVSLLTGPVLGTLEVRGFDLGFEPKQLTVEKPGRYTITLVNDGSIVHDLVIGLLIGNLLWLAGHPIFTVVLWWESFLILTIAGERLELGRLRQLPRSIERAFALLVVVLLAGCAISILAPDVGVRAASVAMVGIAFWLLRYDIARRTVRKPGLTRYIAVCLLSGYIWLGVGGLIGAFAGAVPAGTLYDAMLHAVFVGFVFAMIFGHAPIIVPALLGVQILFAQSFYAPLVLLHLSLATRVAGNLAHSGALRQWGGTLNAVALLLFLMTMVWAAGKQGSGIRDRGSGIRDRRMTDA
jgi:hypothetical protein